MRQLIAFMAGFLIMQVVLLTMRVKELEKGIQAILTNEHSHR